jgi:hypothetical protein
MKASHHYQKKDHLAKTCLRHEKGLPRHNNNTKVPISGGAMIWGVGGARAIGHWFQYT